MRRIARLLARLYPRQWRDRYGREFDALLEDTALRGSDVFDLLGGALRMRFQYPKTWARLGIFVAAGVLAGVAVAYIVEPEYLATSNGQFFYRSENDRNAFMQQLLTRRRLSGIILGENLFAQERLRLPMEDVIEFTRKGIWMSDDGVLHVRASDRNAASQIAAKLVNSEIVGEPLPVRPFLPWYAASGFGIGLVAFAINALFRLLARKTPPAVVS